MRLSCLSSSVPTGTAGWTADGRRGTEIVPGIAAGAATGVAGGACGVNASLTAGFAGAFGDEVESGPRCRPQNKHYTPESTWLRNLEKGKWKMCCLI